LFARLKNIYIKASQASENSQKIKARIQVAYHKRRYIRCNRRNPPLQPQMHPLLLVEGKAAGRAKRRQDD